jgi:hypothetical protein
MSDDDVDIEELTNFERLARALPETGIARALLEAWRKGDASSRTARLVGVAQPPAAKTETDNAAPED